MTTKTDIYQEVTDRIISELEGGRIPWVKPWQAVGSAAMPSNAVSHKAYSGVNVVLLWMSATDSEFTSNRWLTYKQARELGGHVAKGSKGTRIVYASKFIPKEERKQARQEGRDPKSRFFLKSYIVFNVDQCEGLPASVTARPAPKSEVERIEAAEAVIASTRADIRHGGGRAYYAPELDYIQLPPIEAFPETEDYYRTALHELGHWTGHKGRLDRDLHKAPTKAEYAREELVAEMAAAFTSSACGIQPTLQHAAYLQSWLAVLKEDKKAIFTAARKASAAADYVLQYADVESFAEAA